jgi:hypothetical protein
LLICTVTTFHQGEYELTVSQTFLTSFHASVINPRFLPQARGL